MEREKPRVIILGGGFGGLQAAKALADAPIDLHLIDANNYHLFQPLLYQVASAGLEPEQVAYPLRAILRKQRNLRFHLARVLAIDVENHRVQTDRETVTFDYLIVALGAQVRTYGIPGLDRFALPLKGLDDAIGIRNHILTAFEQASLEQDSNTRADWLRFVIVGGGPTGVEMAGAFAELIQHVMQKDYPELNFEEVEIHLVESLGSLLSGFPRNLQDAAINTLKEKGVVVQLDTAVESYDGVEVHFKGGGSLRARSLIWAAGVKGQDVLKSMNENVSPDQRVIVAPSLQIPSDPCIYVIGDAAYLESDGEALPMMAPVAVQMADCVAANIKRQIAGQGVLPFQYRDPGRLATIGRNAAVADIRGFRFRGFLAWLVWLVVHLIQLVGFRNRIMVLINWAWEYFFYDRAVRLIIKHGVESGQPDPR